MKLFNEPPAEIISQIYQMYRKTDPKQIDIDDYLLEELNELQVEIHHLHRRRSDRPNLAKEIADVEVLLYQFKKKYNLFQLVNEAITEEITKVPSKIEKWKQWKQTKQLENWRWEQ